MIREEVQGDPNALRYALMEAIIKATGYVQTRELAYLWQVSEQHAKRLVNDYRNATDNLRYEGRWNMRGWVFVPKARFEYLECEDTGFTFLLDYGQLWAPRAKNIEELMEYLCDR